jgi:hypothetical protein
LVKKRSQHQHWSKQKRQVADQIAEKLHIVPFLEAVLLTGAVSVNNATKNDDIDICIITTPESLWTCRLFAVLKLERLGIRRRPHTQVRSDQICLNLLLAANELTVPPALQNLYTAHEVIQTKPLFDPKGYHSRFIAANAWIHTYLPNIVIPKMKTRPAVSKQAPLSVESSLRFVEQLYMRPKRTREMITPGKAYFHPRDTAGIVLSHFNKKLMEYHLS